jgi:hypothetical protein
VIALLLGLFACLAGRLGNPTAHNGRWRWVPARRHRATGAAGPAWIPYRERIGILTVARSRCGADCAWSRRSSAKDGDRIDTTCLSAISPFDQKVVEIIQSINQHVARSVVPQVIHRAAHRASRPTAPPKRRGADRPRRQRIVLVIGTAPLFRFRVRNRPFFVWSTRLRTVRADLV